MIMIPRNDDASAKEDRYPSNLDELPCIICGRPCKVARAAMVLVADCQTVNGQTWGLAACTEEEFEKTDPAVRLYGYPIGPDCLRKHPELKPYINPALLEAAAE